MGVITRNLMYATMGASAASTAANIYTANQKEDVAIPVAPPDPREKEEVELGVGGSKGMVGSGAPLESTTPVMTDPTAVPTSSTGLRI